MVIFDWARALSADASRFFTAAQLLLQTVQDDTLFPTRHVTEVVKAVHAKASTRERARKPCTFAAGISVEEGPLPAESPFYAELKVEA